MSNRIEASDYDVPSHGVHPHFTTAEPVPLMLGSRPRAQNSNMTSRYAPINIRPLLAVRYSHISAYIVISWWDMMEGK